MLFRSILLVWSRASSRKDRSSRGAELADGSEKDVLERIAGDETSGRVKGDRPESARNDCLFRLDEDLQLVRGPQAKASFIDLENARTPFLQQLQPCTTAQPHGGQASDFTLAPAKRQHGGLIASFQVL